MKLPVEGFLIDKHPVTNAEYGAYLAASGYKPVDAYNFLLNWVRRDSRVLFPSNRRTRGGLGSECGSSSRPDLLSCRFDSP